MTQPTLRPLAEVDLVERTQYYAAVGGPALGERFFDAAIEALRALADMPAVGSPRVGEITGIAGLRMRRIVGFPCGWFYFADDERVDVIRLLADTQDLRAALDDGDQAGP